MDKRTFLEKLETLTAALPEAERSRLIDYYAEMIDDRVEEGMAEEDAVAALGEPEALAGELSPAPAAASSGGEMGASQTVAALRSLKLSMSNADVTVERAPLENGAAAQLRFSDPERFSWRMEGDALVVEQIEADAPRFSVRWVWHALSDPQQKLTVTLAEALPGDLDFTSAGGDLTLEGVAVEGATRLDSGSGDLRLSGCRLAALELASRSGDAKLTSVALSGGLRAKFQSGDMDASALSAAGGVRLEAASGDITLRELSCGKLSLSTASGDIEIDRGRAGEADIRAASGEVRLTELETDPGLTVSTASGDVALYRCIARETRIETASGDVALRLEELPCGYDIFANSRSGDISIDTGDIPADPNVPHPRVNISTASGDIDARVIR